MHYPTHPEITIIPIRGSARVTPKHSWQGLPESLCLLHKHPASVIDMDICRCMHIGKGSRIDMRLKDAATHQKRRLDPGVVGLADVLHREVQNDLRIRLLFPAYVLQE